MGGALLDVAYCGRVRSVGGRGGSWNAVGHEDGVVVDERRIGVMIRVERLSLLVTSITATILSTCRLGVFGVQEIGWDITNVVCIGQGDDVHAWRDDLLTFLRHFLFLWHNRHEHCTTFCLGMRDPALPFPC